MSDMKSRVRSGGHLWPVGPRKNRGGGRNVLKIFDAGRVYWDYLGPLRTKPKTTNPIERYIEEVRRRMIPMRSFGNVTSTERAMYVMMADVPHCNQDMPRSEFAQIARHIEYLGKYKRGCRTRNYFLT